MTSIAQRLKREIGGVARVCGLWTGLKFSLACLLSLPRIARDKTLQAADRAMGDVHLDVQGARLAYPTRALDDANILKADSPAFSAVREIFARDVYGHGFKNLPRIDTMLDLGANRGVVTLYGSACLGARWICGVEPTESYNSVFRVLADANQLTPEQSHRIAQCAGATHSNDTVSVGQILKTHGIETLNFLKCDIEGGENAVFLDADEDFLDRTERIVMEMHPGLGARTSDIVARLSEAGFHCKAYDNNKHPCAIPKADYIFASKEHAELA